MEIPDTTRSEFDRRGNDKVRYCAPALIMPSIEAYLNEVIDSGTLSLIETPNKQLFVTAFHVWRAFTEFRAQHQDAVLGVYLGPPNGVTALSDELEYLDGDEQTLDVAILHTPRAGKLQLLGKSFFRIPEWPIPRVHRGDSVDAVGYIGKDREPLGPRGVIFGNTHFGFGVSSVSDRQFVLAPDFGRRVFLQKNPIHKNEFEIGGMSGGPVFCTRDDVTHLVGFLRAGSVTSSCIFVSHASFLRADGTLDHLTIPHA